MLCGKLRTRNLGKTSLLTASRRPASQRQPRKKKSRVTAGSVHLSNNIVRKPKELLVEEKRRKEGNVRERQGERNEERKRDNGRGKESARSNLLGVTRLSSRRKMASYFDLIFICCILVLPFFYETSRTFRYHYKFFVYCITVLFNALWLLPIFSLRPRNVKNFMLVIVL